MPGLIPHRTTGDWLYATSALICSSARPVRNGGGAADERDVPAERQARADADHVLLGDPDVDQPVGKLRRERDQVAGADRVVADRDDPLVVAGERDQLLGEGDPAVEGLGTGSDRRAHRASSATAVSSCSAVGTLWCHSTRSSMNETPLPLIVLAMTQVGRSVARRA